MISYNFKRTTASFQEDGSVTLETKKNTEVIEMAGDWWEGKAIDILDERYGTTGYVGKGYSKYGIYVRLSVFGNSLLTNAEGKISRKRICHGYAW